MTRKKPETTQPYRTDLINGAMGALRLTNEVVAEKAKVAPKTVSAIRNGDPKVGLPSLRAVVEAVGLTMDQIFQKEEKAA
jgi:Predicted transcriptional regulators